MTSRDFMYWLQGFAELYGGPPTAEQWRIIRAHLNLVFKHEIDPSMPDPDGVLQATHDGEPTTPTAPPTPAMHNLFDDPQLYRC